MAALMNPDPKIGSHNLPFHDLHQWVVHSTSAMARMAAVLTKLHISRHSGFHDLFAIQTSPRAIEKLTVVQNGIVYQARARS